MSGRTLKILVAGGSSPSGIAVARALRGAGHAVFTVGSDAARIAAPGGAAPCVFLGGSPPPRGRRGRRGGPATALCR